jgi:hypothetical protein
MKPIVPLAVISIYAVCFLGVLSVSASTEDVTRVAAMDQELNCVSNHVKKGVDWNDVCYTSSGSDKDRLVTKSMDQMIQEHKVAAEDMASETIDTIAREHGAYADSAKSVDNIIEEQGTVQDTEGNTNTTGNSLDSSKSDQPQYVQYARNDTGRGYEPVDLTPQGSLADPAQSLTDRVENQNKWEVGLEYNHQRYVEPIFDLTLKGSLYGGYLGYTARPPKNENFFEDVVDVFKLEGRFQYGSVDYQSAGNGKTRDENNWTYELRGLVGKDFSVLNTSRLTPYSGIGFRYLDNDGSGHVTDLGFSGYNRISRYLYIPLGVEFSAKVSEDWILSPSMEYDFFINGTQISEIDPRIKNKQDSGFGMRGSLKLVKLDKAVNFIVEPYVRYWHIDDSDHVVVSPFVYTEPENKTTEYGVRLGVEF